MSTKTRLKVFRITMQNNREIFTVHEQAVDETDAQNKAIAKHGNNKIVSVRLADVADELALLMRARKGKR